MFLNSSAFYVVFTLFPKQRGALSWSKVMRESSYLCLQILRYNCPYFAHIMRCGSVCMRQDNAQKSPKNAIEDRQIIQVKHTVVPIWSVISKASQGPFLKCKRVHTSFPNRVQGLALRESPIYSGRHKISAESESLWKSINYLSVLAPGFWAPR